MTAAGDMRAAQLLAAELGDHGHLSIELSPMEALAVIGQMHLAMRHPSNQGPTTAIARTVIERIVDAYATGGPADQFRAVVAAGDPAPPPPPSLSVAPSTALERFGFDVVTDESIPPDTIEVRGATTTRVHVPRGWSPPPLSRDQIVRPAGLVWSGIRVDEMARLYEVLDRSHESCPFPLADGEILGDPATGRVYVWSRADFDRLSDLSRALHDARRGRAKLGPVAAAICARLEREADVDALMLARQLERGGH